MTSNIKNMEPWVVNDIREILDKYIWDANTRDELLEVLADMKCEVPFDRVIRSVIAKIQLDRYIAKNGSWIVSRRKN